MCLVFIGPGLGRFRQSPASVPQWSLLRKAGLWSWPLPASQHHCARLNWSCSAVSEPHALYCPHLCCRISSFSISCSVGCNQKSPRTGLQSSSEPSYDCPTFLTASLTPLPPQSLAHTWCGSVLRACVFLSDPPRGTDPTLTRLSGNLSCSFWCRPELESGGRHHWFRFPMARKKHAQCLL